MMPYVIHTFDKVSSMLTLTLIIGGWISSGKAPATCLGADLAVRLQQLMNAPITLQQAQEEPSHLTPQRVNGLISP